MKHRFYIPKEGVQIRNHDGRGFIPAEGAVRMQSQYYDRRVKDGDLIVRDEPLAPIEKDTVGTSSEIQAKKSGKGVA